MKKFVLLLFMLPLALCLHGQTKQTQTTKTTKPAAPKPAPARDTSLCGKKWVLIAVEEWAVESKPKKKQVDDYLWMNGDGTYKLKRNGEDKAGTWAKQAAYINFTDDASKEKFTYKVESAEPKKLKVDYHVTDMHTLFTFEVK
ncbi:MAG: hypothetical protein ACHQRM_14600 [Bacteroidia bacterium]